MVIMQNGENNNSSTQEALSTPPPEDLTKDWYRQKVWKHLEKNGLAYYPRPVYNRVPNFRGAVEAAERLCELDIFKSAKNIEVSPERPQEPVRCEVLKAGKNLFMPILSLKEGLTSQIVLPEDVQNVNFKKAVSRWGYENYGKKIGLNDKISLDLVVVGSVAVSRNGDRVGKGRGYTSLEFGLLMQMKAINPNTLVVTTVHDCQVFDDMPKELFAPHDVPVDIIVTPTQVIKTVRYSLGKPTGVIWSYLSNRKLNLLPIVQELHEKEMLAGHPCVLKAEDTDAEEVFKREIRTRPRRPKHFIYRNNPKNDNGQVEVTNSQSRPQKTRRLYRRSDTNRRPSVGDDPSGDGAAAPDTTTRRPRQPKKPKLPVIFSIKVSNIKKPTRRRDLKDALDERGVKPYSIRWLGYKGYCFLHFTKPATEAVEGDSLVTLESVCEALSDLSIYPKSSETLPEAAVEPNKLLVEPAKPRQTKIETADITAV